MLLVVLADTHLQDRVTAQLPRPALQAIEAADLVLHAGDLVSEVALRELEALAPTLAVLGNNDRDLVGRLAPTIEIELEGVRIAMVHDAGEQRGRERRLKQRFPAADIVIFGHSHVPLDSTGLDGQLLFNPGSPTQRRAQPRHSFGRIELADGQLGARTIEFC